MYENGYGWSYSMEKSLWIVSKLFVTKIEFFLSFYSEFMSAEDLVGGNFYDDSLSSTTR